MLLCGFCERTLYIFVRTLIIVLILYICKMPARCAFGCERRGVHHIPNPYRFPQQFEAWVHILGGKLERSEDYKAYEDKRVCAIHFTENDYSWKNRLNSVAVPTQHLPAWCLIPRATDCTSTSLPQSIESTAKLLAKPDSTIMEKAPCAFPKQIDSASTCMPQEMETAAKLLPQVVESSLPELMVPATAATSKPSTTLELEPSFAEGSYIDWEHNYCLKPTKKQPSFAEGSYIDWEHNYCLKPTKKRMKFRKPLDIQKMKTMARQIKNLRNEVLRLRKRSLTFQARLENATRISDHMAFKQITKHMTEPAKLFTYMNFREAKKKPKGRRFSNEEKILCLSIFKRSPKCYTLLSKYFTLPSRKSLKNLLASVTLHPGINQIIFDKLKKNVKSMNVEDTLCTLIFDEMSITPQIHYNVARDELKGFTSLTNENNISDHVLVFMLKGIKNNFKQPIAYYFTNSLHKDDLKIMISEVITNVHLTGLKIVCTVCDQSTVNVSAINSLIADTRANNLRKGIEWREEHFKINQKKIIPLYDCPHLLKGLRNNLLTKDLIYEDNGHKKIVKWSYFEMLYAADKSQGELRCVQKLTEEHVNKDKIKKMRVKHAAQVFSRAVALATDHLCTRGDLPPECRDLIPFVILIDNLFDSLNSSTFHIPNGKIYKAGLKRNSPHHDYWLKAIKVLKSAKFIAKKINNDKIRFVETTVPSLTNFIKTIEAVQNVWKILNKDYSFDSLLTRNLNQDPLENFFGNIRSYGYRNVAPNSVNFEGAFKALLLNNFSSPHSIQANCEEDNNHSLQDLKFFLTEKSNIPKETRESDSVIHINEFVLKSFDNDYVTDEDKGQRNYVCGWVVTKCLKTIAKNCKDCRKDLLDSDNGNSAAHSFTRAKEYNIRKKWLCYPSKNVLSIFHNIQKATCAFLRRDVQRRNLKSNIKILCDTLIDYKFTCKIHNIKDYFLDISINLLICSWCRSINRILSGKINYEGEDQIKSAAQAYHCKHKQYKSK